MNIKLVKRLLVSSLAGIMMMSMAACGSAPKEADGAETAAVSEKEEATGSAGVTELTIWSPTDEASIENWWVEKLAEWNAAHPDIQVSREAIDRSDSYAYDNKIAAAVTSNDLPDIFYVDGPQVSYYAANEIIVPITKYFSDEELKDFAESTVNQGTYNNELYA